MAARREQTLTAKQQAKAKRGGRSSANKNTNDDSNSKNAHHETATDVVDEHLPPLALIFTIIACSGLLFMFGFRDFFATGKNIGGSWDEAMLLFTKSTDWFDDSKGWKSTQGGFSVVSSVTTDDNNMGGLFVRKLAGGAALAVHLQKLVPVLVHPFKAEWSRGDFAPLLQTAVVANVIVAAFYGYYWQDLTVAGATQLPTLFLAALGIESMVMLFYLFSGKAKNKKQPQRPAIALPEGKTPTSVVSRIVTRTVLMVSTAMFVIFGRDLFAPGSIIEFIPRDDIYLEWTNAFLHSPPEGSPEEIDQGLQAPLHVGDKFMSQFAALHILILCLYKIVSAFLHFKADGSGVVRSKMFWKVQAVGDTLLLWTFRIFTPAAESASLDLRWHLMVLAYEMFVLGLYGFF